MKATIKSSQRQVDIAIEGNTFCVIHPPNGRTDSFWRAMGYQPVSGPFPLNDQRFEIDTHSQEKTND